MRKRELGQAWRRASVQFPMESFFQISRSDFYGRTQVVQTWSQLASLSHQDRPGNSLAASGLAQVAHHWFVCLHHLAQSTFLGCCLLSCSRTISAIALPLEEFAVVDKGIRLKISEVLEATCKSAKKGSRKSKRRRCLHSPNLLLKRSSSARCGFRDLRLQRNRILCP